MYNFYDTSSLLKRANDLFQTEEQVVISSITLEELENIKESTTKSADVKLAARKLLQLLNSRPNAYEVHIFKADMLVPILHKGFGNSNDMKILACAIDYDKFCHPDDTMFITNDLALRCIANLFFGEDSISSVEDEQITEYTGYKEVILSELDMNNFYSNMNQNHFNLLLNQYLIIRNENNEIIDKYCWDGYTHRPLNIKPFTSKQFGPIRPMKDDHYQMLVFDSLSKNDVTMICGKPGSGKTYIAFAYLFEQLERGNIDRIVIFCNPVVAKNAAKLGFYPGSPFEKLMGSQVGAVLSSKLGDTTEVERLNSAGKLVLVPAGDARGYEVPQNSGVYIMESQNLTCDLLRMLLQRVSEGCKVIVDGDYNEQVDMEIYAGHNNGMKKMSEVFRGQSIYGQVELKNIHRSTIARLADEMK